MQTMLNDIRYAVRTMLRSPGWTSMAIVTLALGTGANTAVFGFVDALLFRPAPGVRAPGGVVTVFTSDFSSGPYGDSSYPDFLSIAGGIAAFERTAAEDDSLVAPVRIGDEMERVRISHVSGEYFNVLGLVPNPGRALAEGDAAAAANVAVVSDEFWRRALGARPFAIGSIVKVNDRAVTVVGIAPPKFRGLDLGRAIDMWLPLTPAPATAEERGNRGVSVIARLRPGHSARDAQPQLAALASQLAREFPKTNLGTLDRPREPRPMVVTPAYRISPEFRGQVMSLSAVLMGGVGLVLVLACANVASLLLSRATARAREIAVRRALGAGSGRLLRQLLTETAVLAFAAGGVGVIIAAWTTDVLPSFFPAEQAALLLDTSPGWHVFVYAIAVAALSSLLVGVLPAIRSIRPPLAAALRGHGGDISDRTGSRLRAGLVSAQVAIACVLLVGAGLLIQSVAHTLDDDLGMRTRDAVLASVELPATWTPATGLAYYDEARARVAALPGVESAGWGRTLTLARTSRRRFDPESYTAVPGEDRELNVNDASAGYFETLGIPLREGRTFTSSDTSGGASVVVVNETLARKYFGGSAVGKHLTDSHKTVLEIVGVVGDTKFLTVAEAPPPLVYYPLTQEYSTRMTLIVRTAVPSERLGDAVRRELRAANANVAVFATTTLRAHVQAALGAERLTASLVSVCGLLALVLAVVGLYGAIAYLVARRTREIGVRMALGATPDRVLALVVGQGLWIAGTGIVAGLLCAALGARTIPLGLYGVTPIDPRTYAAVTTVLLLTAALAAFVPARRAVRIDPARALAQD